MPGGRPTKYREDYPDQARRLALLGMTDEEVADFFEVDPDTLYEWDKVHPEFSEIRARGKVHADAKMAESLYHRGLGYHHPDTHVSAFQGAVTLTPITKHYPPDTQAATLWLSNRQGGKWKLKSSTEVTGPNGGPIEANLTHERLTDRIARFAATAATPAVPGEPQPGGMGGTGGRQPETDPE